MHLDTISIYSRSSKPRRVRQPLVGVARGWAGHRVTCCMEIRDRLCLGKSPRLARAARPRPLAPRIFLALPRLSFARSGLGYLVICPPTVYAVARLDMDILPPLRGWTAEGGGSHMAIPTWRCRKIRHLAKGARHGAPGFTSALRSDLLSSRAPRAGSWQAVQYRETPMV
jgi:hypothetical protein